MIDTESSPYRSHLSIARKTAQDRIEDELSGVHDLWVNYSEGIKHYDKNFKYVLPEGFERFITSHESKLLFLDALAPSSFLRELAQTEKGVKAGISLTLTDLRTPEEKDVDRSLHIEQLSKVDIYDRAKWIQDVKKFLMQYGQSGFDVITCIPGGAWVLREIEGEGVLPFNDNLWLVTNLLWSLLNENGEMFIKYSYRDRESYEGWINKLKNLGIIVSAEDDQVRFKKTRNVKGIPAFPQIKRV